MAKLKFPRLNDSLTPWSEISLFTSLSSLVNWEWWTFFKISLWKLIYEKVFYTLLNPIKLHGFSSCIVISNKNISIILLHHPNKAFILKAYTKGKQGKQVRISAYNKFSGKQICYSSHMAAFYNARL